MFSMVKRKFGASVRAKTFPAQVNETLHWTAKTGNGSLYTTARDLLAFHHALQRGLLLRPETVVAAHGFDRADRKVGMFWFHHVVAGHRAVYVGGSSPGFKAHLERFIDDDTCVIVLSNLYVAAATPIANSPRRCSLVRPTPPPRSPRRRTIKMVAASSVRDARKAAHPEVSARSGTGLRCG
jgi:hypothetical protein